MVHTFLESSSNLDVHTGIRFWMFEKNGVQSTLYGYVMLTKGSIALRLRVNCLSYSNDLYIFGKPNRPRCASWVAMSHKIALRLHLWEEHAFEIV